MSSSNEEALDSDEKGRIHTPSIQEDSKRIEANSLPGVVASYTTEETIDCKNP